MVGVASNEFVRCLVCGDAADMLAPQRDDDTPNGVHWVPVCQDCAIGWTDASEPEYGISRYPAYYIDDARQVRATVLGWPELQEQMNAI